MKPERQMSQQCVDCRESDVYNDIPNYACILCRELLETYHKPKKNRNKSDKGY